MTTMHREHAGKSQIGSTASSSQPYATTDGDINFVAGQTILVRIPTVLSKSSILNSAILNFSVHVKDSNTTQSSTHIVRAHASGDSPMLVVGAVENRTKTTASVSWTPTWTAGQAEVMSAINVEPLIRELMARSDFKVGAYITFMVECVTENGSDMGVRGNNDFLPKPSLDVVFEEPSLPQKFTINELENPQFDASLAGIDGTNPIPFWFQSAFFGGQVDPSASGGTMAVDTNFVRKSGIPTLKFTCGTPDSDVTKRTGPATAAAMDKGLYYIFCGWVYLPNTIPVNAEAKAAEAYLGANHLINERNQWVPFCTDPLRKSTDRGTFWASFSLMRFQAGWQFWISEPTVMVSAFKQMPFNGLTPTKGVENYRTSSSNQRAVREWAARTSIRALETGNNVIGCSRWIKKNNIFVLSEPVKGGLTYAQTNALSYQDEEPRETYTEA